MVIVGISGPARSGKDTVANALHARYLFRILHFADALKDACERIFGFSREQLYGAEKEVVDPYWLFSPRFAMQTVGDGLRNTVCPDIWIKAAMRQLDRLERAGFSRIVIPDCRYPNELKALTDRMQDTVYLIRITRPGIESALTPDTAKHASEVALNDYTEWDFKIDNKGSFEDLYYEVDNIVKCFDLVR